MKYLIQNMFKHPRKLLQQRTSVMSFLQITTSLKKVNLALHQNAKNSIMNQ